MKPLRYGAIIRATVADPNGQNPKNRPLVVLTAMDELVDGEPFVAVAISTSVAGSDASVCVRLPWSRPKHPRTGLSADCVVVCNWLVELEVAAVESVIGAANAAEMQAINDVVSRLAAE